MAPVYESAGLDAQEAPCARFSARSPISMANTKSAEKAARQTVRRTGINKSRTSRMKAYVRKVEEAIASGSKDAAKAALALAQPILMRSAQKRVIHKKAASRKVARLTARLKAMP
jgi:small subunit ribosomal protein S20